jgi:hypothetical protein
MFVNINRDSFPLIQVTFENKIESYEDLDIFFQTWLQQYEDKKHFTFLLDTIACGNIPIKYCHYMAKQISKIKKLDKHYLQQTIVIIQSNWIKNLMKLLFKIVKPIAPVYIVKNQDIAKTLYFRISNNLLKSDLEYDFINAKVKPLNNPPCYDIRSQ